MMIFCPLLASGGVILTIVMNNRARLVEHFLMPRLFAHMKTLIVAAVI